MRNSQVLENSIPVGCVWRSEIGKGMKEGGGGGGGFPPVLIPIYAASEPRPVTTPEAV